MKLLWEVLFILKHNIFYNFALKKHLKEVRRKVYFNSH